MIAWCRRFKVNCFKPREGRQVGPLTLVEIRNANICLVKIAQRECFLNEIEALAAGKSLDSKSSILNLNPFIHSDDTLRVGGRLDQSSF